MRYEQRKGLAGIVLAVFALTLGACAHRDGYPETGNRGSLKDDVVSEVPARKRVRTTPRPKVSQAPVSPAPVSQLAAKAPASQPRASAPVTGSSSAPAAAPTPPPAPAPAPPAAAAEPPIPPVEEPAAVARMLSEGQALFEAGKVLQARRRFVAAMNGPLPEVLLALARTYDTYYLSRLPTSDAAPDMQRALVLYERALERGASDATADLERTRGILKIPR